MCEGRRDPRGAGVLMSGGPSRARRVAAVQAAKDAVYAMRGQGAPENPFECPRQRRIFDETVMKFRGHFCRMEARCNELLAAYEGNGNG